SRARSAALSASLSSHALRICSCRAGDIEQPSRIPATTSTTRRSRIFSLATRSRDLRLFAAIGAHVPSLTASPVDEPAGEAGRIDLSAVSVNGLLAPEVFDGAVGSHAVPERPVRELLGTAEREFGRG